ncbi:hypothetical protein [Klebsiella pneumoniae]|jgi:hypothetical protein|uniref:hypothetical protein n=1 Tax=Klebsiella pneumoniae TaxID=573 RepID=UPI000E2B531C|nr:hypothetical protein [Klebsiella pneumoniae]SWF08099.1 Uncharacterised protein [Klebsiella pneumoniae]
MSTIADIKTLNEVIAMYAASSKLKDETIALLQETIALLQETIAAKDNTIKILEERISKVSA